MTNEISHVWVVNWAEEPDPRYVFVDEDQAREFASRYPDAIVTEKPVTNAAAGAHLLDTHESGGDESSEHNNAEPQSQSVGTRAWRAFPKGEDDATALDTIAWMLCDPEWAPGMLEDIADIVRRTGRSVDNLPGDVPTWDRH